MKESLKINVLLLLAVLFTFLSCKRDVATTEQVYADAHYLALGDSISAASFASIRAALLGAIEQGGLENAINHCKLVAIPITDSLSDFYGVKISRVTDRFRNPINAASEVETKLMDEYRSNKSSIGNMLLHEENQKIFYKPIITQAFCLNCHGTSGKELTEANLKLIQFNYPDDKATGYNENEVRGLWKIVFTTIEP
jgi:hypothetical protein